MSDQPERPQWWGRCKSCGAVQAGAVEMEGETSRAVASVEHPSLNIGRVLPGDADYPVTLEAPCGCWERGRWVRPPADPNQADLFGAAS